MAAVVFPQEAVVQYVKDLLRIAGEATRDASTLSRQAASLMNERTHGRVMGTLRRYANEREQFGADEIREIVADMEAFVDPKIVEQKKQIQAQKDARAERWREEKEAEVRAAWEPGGRHWAAARDQMMADAHALIFAAKSIGDSDDERLVGALREYCESEERGRLFDRLSDSLKPPPEAPPAPSKRRSRTEPRARGGNVVDGPWAS